jgi:hypothetical protein
MDIAAAFAPRAGTSATRRAFLTSGFGAALAGSSIAARPSPNLTVVIILGMLRPDHIEGARNRLIAGGLRRMLENGCYFPNCRHLASTFPSSTLATLATGSWPAVHGIVADSWYERSARRHVQASGEQLIGSTLVAEAAAAPQTRAFVVGMDGPRTRLFAGTSSASLFWMDARGQFATPGDPPEWLVAYNRQKPLENLRNTAWLAIGARPDAPPLRKLVYSDDRPEDFYTLYKASPYAQMAQFEFVRELMAREKIGMGPGRDLLCLLLGSTELLGYDTGARSPLIDQMVMHLDRHLEFLIDQLNRAPGRMRYNLVLTAAHGAPVEPSADARARLAVAGDQVVEALQKSLPPAGPKLEKYVYPFLSLDPAARESEPARLAVARAALHLPAVAGYYTAGGACSTSSEWGLRFRNSFHSQRSGELMLSYRPGYVEEFGAGRGVSYGSLYNYDASVPLLLLGPQFAKRTFDQGVESVDIAPTLAHAMGIPAPSASTGRVLAPAFRRLADPEA